MTQNWYVVQTQTNFEDKAKSELERLMRNPDYAEKIIEVIVPTEDIIKISKNKKTVNKRKFFPGYVMVKMDLDEDTYWAVRKISGVKSFLSDRKKPIPLKEEEVAAIKEILAAPNLRPRPVVTFEKDETLRIIDGPFKLLMGIVQDIYPDKARLKLMVTIFGRPTPVELDFTQVEKM
ncbi:MAG: transcription termination/antitermination protein NusG [Endomicrobiia bacterium]|nr:transcription termination/antitermination protein NusG [Endomicrobiia bacterium]